MGEDLYHQTCNPPPATQADLSWKPLAIAIIHVLMVMIVIEYGAAKRIANTTGTVIHMEMSVPEKLGESLFLIVIKRKHQLYQVRTTKEYYDSILLGDHLLLIDRRTRLTNRIVETTLFDTHEPLRQAFCTPINPIAGGETPAIILTHESIYRNDVNRRYLTEKEEK